MATPKKTDKTFAEGVVENSDTIVDELVHWGRGVQSYDAMLAGNDVDVVEGSDLLDKKLLEGVPHIITRIVFRPSGKSDKNYVSVEAITKDNEQVVYNDGSTGIRRQLMNYALAKGWAVPAEEAHTVISEAKAQPNNVLDYGDLPIDMFDWDLPAEMRFDNNGDRLVVISDLKLHAKRGLRPSDYKWKDENGKERDATTYYLG